MAELQGSLQIEVAEGGIEVTGEDTKWAQFTVLLNIYTIVFFEPMEYQCFYLVSTLYYPII